MCFKLRAIVFAMVALVCVISLRTSHGAESRTSIILDTDVDHDCDDIGALFMLHGAVERGEAKLLATMGCTSSTAIAPCLDAINTWFGRAEIPVGTLKDKDFHDHKGFANEMILRYPHQHPSGADYPDAVHLYRKILAQQPDNSVVILAVGPLRNLANLVRSPPDDISALDGKSLVAQKVKRLDVMGGNYPPQANAKDAEWNFKQDPKSAALVCSTWPTPILFNGEGGSVNSGRRVTFEMPEHNPLTMAYRLYPGVGYAGDRLSWDPISALVAISGPKPWFELVDGGRNVVDAETGINAWQPDKAGRHAYLVLKSTKPELEAALEDQMTRGKGRPQHLQFNTVYYADTGMCRATFTGERSKQGEWLNKAASGWLQYQHADDRKYLVTSYAVTCQDPSRAPHTIELLGSNDQGAHWTRLDYQDRPGFTDKVPRREFTVAKPGKWNVYRLVVTAADERKETLLSSIELLESIHAREDVSPTKITVDLQAVTVPVYGRATLSATVSPLDTFEREVRWVSSDPSVAKIKRIGEQLAMVVGQKPGKCTISATIGDVVHACEVTVVPATLPGDWEYHELNSPAIPGAVSVSNNEFTLTGCGHAMTSWWQRVRDQGAFVSRPTAELAEVSARLKSLSPNAGGPAYQWDNRPPTAAGLMIREALSEACGRYVLIQVEASGNLVCRWREKSGDQDDNQRKDLGQVALPVYLKLVRDGDQIHVFASPDQERWGEPRMSITATFSETSRMGLLVCSGNTFASATVVADNVRAGK